MRRVPRLLAVLAVLAAGCAGDGTEGAERPKRPASHAPTSTTTQKGEAPPVTASSASTTTAKPPVTTAKPSTSATTGTTSAPPTTATTARPVALADVNVRLTRVARLDAPLAMAQRPGDDTLYVAGQQGRVQAVRGTEVAAEPVLDLAGEVRAGGEQGLLGIAFSPDGNLLYASFTDRLGDSRLWEYHFADGRADVSTRRELLFQKQPFANHNGGQVSFGPDGLLYYFLGDGGAANDPAGNAQNLGTLLGKILRIDPKPSESLPYTIPPDNPFVGRPDARGEIYSFGLRNPWRASWDRASSDLWIGDVGQNSLEEIDFSPKDAARGANFGWAAFEGSRPGPRPVPPAEGHVPPVHEYPTAEGCAVTGGYVYRGSRIPGLAGAYLFGDYCNGEIRALRLMEGKVIEQRALGLQVDQLASFGEDHAGELYALSLAGDLFRIDPA